MLLLHRKNGLTSLFKEVRVFKGILRSASAWPLIPAFLSRQRFRKGVGGLAGGGP